MARPTPVNTGEPSRTDIAGASSAGHLFAARLAPTFWWVLGAGLPLFFLAVFFLLPLGAMLGLGFFPDGQLSLSGFTEIFTQPRIWRVVGFTLGLAAGATAVCLVLGTIGAYALYKLQFPGQRILRALIVVPFILPSVVVGLAFQSLYGASRPLGFLGLEETFTLVLLAMIFFNYSIVVRMVGGLWSQLGDQPEQVGAALGASPARIWWQITLPRLRAVLFSAGSLVFLFCATAFGVVLVLGGARMGTIETEIWVYSTQFFDLSGAAVLSIVQVVIVIAALVLTSRASRSVTENQLHAGGVDAGSGANSSTRAGRVSGGRGGIWRHWTFTVSLAVIVLVQWLPLLSMTLGALRADGHWTIKHFANLASPGVGFTSVVSAFQAAGNSVKFALLGAVVSLVLGLCTAAIISRPVRLGWARRALQSLDVLMMLPLGVSAVTIGFGFLITMHDIPLLGWNLRTSALLVPLAQALVAMPLVVRTVLPVFSAIDPRSRHAAASLGMYSQRIFLNIDLAIVWRALVLAFSFALAASLGEFGATAFLATPQQPTLPVMIYNLLNTPGADNLGLAMAASVVLSGLTVVLMLGGEALRDKKTAGVSW